MPELPDVERYNRYLRRHALRRTITGVHVGDRRVLAHVSGGSLHKALTGGRLLSTRRHGKHLLVRLSKGGWLTMHFGMTGSLAYYAAEKDKPRFDRLRLDFGKSSHLAYTDPRLLGRVGLADDADEFVKKQRLGPDLLDRRFTLARFKAALARAGNLKAALMDQSRMAGIGNIYADEVLFQAGIDPRTNAGRLSPQQAGALFRAARRVLKKAVTCGAGAEILIEKLPRSYLLRQRHAGGICPRGHGKLKMIRTGGRATYFCPRCQVRP